MEVLNTLQRADLRLFASVFRQGRRRAVVPIARAISHSGDGYLHLLLPLGMWLAGFPATGALATLLILSLAIERSLYWVLKNSLRRRRPQDLVPGFRSLIVAADRFSFPSGHTSGAFLLATALAVVYGSPMASLYAWAVGVALSRVVLGVHFPGDTVAGALMGTAITLLCAAGLA